MKTICPYCHQKYEVAMEYSGITLECQQCHQSFIALNAENCPVCGALNHAKALTCRKCGQRLIPQKANPVSDDDVPLQFNPFGRSTPTPADAQIRSWEDVGLGGITFTALIIANVLYLLSILLYSIVTLFFLAQGRVILLIYLFFFIPMIIFQCFVVGMISVLTRPEKKALWTPMRKISIWGNMVLSFITIVVSMIISVFASIRQTAMTPLDQTLATFLYLLMFLLGVLIYVLFRKRAALDIDYEEPEFPQDQNTLLFARVCFGTSIAGIILPPLGIISFILGLTLLKRESIMYEPEIKHMAWYGIMLGGAEIFFLVILLGCLFR